MIKREDIVDIVEHCKGMGYNIRVRDVAFAVLSKVFEDGNMAYQCLFGDEGYERYVQGGERGEIERYMRQRGWLRGEAKEGEDIGLTFEENRREMVKLIAETQRSMDEGLIDAKDGLKIISDIRVKLNDKFKVQDEGGSRVIIVNKKYNDVCHHCGREVYIPTVEDLKERYNLTEKR